MNSMKLFATQTIFTFNAKEWANQRLKIEENIREMTQILEIKMGFVSKRIKNFSIEFTGM